MITDQMVEAALQAYCGQDHQLDFGVLGDHLKAMRAALEAAEDAGFCIDTIREPTHWRPLPAAPKGEK